MLKVFKRGCLVHVVGFCILLCSMSSFGMKVFGGSSTEQAPITQLFNEWHKDVLKIYSSSLNWYTLDYTFLMIFKSLESNSITYVDIFKQAEHEIEGFFFKLNVDEKWGGCKIAKDIFNELLNGDKSEITDVLLNAIASYGDAETLKRVIKKHGERLTSHWWCKVALNQKADADVLLQLVDLDHSIYIYLVWAIIDSNKNADNWVFQKIERTHCKELCTFLNQKHSSPNRLNDAVLEKLKQCGIICVWSEQENQYVFYTRKEFNAKNALSAANQRD